MLKTLTLRMAASTLLVFSVGVALAAGPGNTDGSLSPGAGAAETVRHVEAPTEGRIRLPRPRKVPSRAPVENGCAQASGDPGEESTGHDASGEAHDRYANAETSHPLD